MLASLNMANKRSPAVVDDSAVCTPECRRTPTLYSLVRDTPGTEVGLVALFRRSRAVRDGIRTRIRGSRSLGIVPKTGGEHQYSQLGSKHFSVQVSSAEYGRPGASVQGPVRSTAGVHGSTRFHRVGYQYIDVTSNLEIRLKNHSKVPQWYLVDYCHICIIFPKSTAITKSVLGPG
jgi:hypothetical protein